MGPRVQGLSRSLQGFHFHFHPDGMGGALQGQLNDLSKPHFPEPVGLDVVVLDENAVGQIVAVVVSPAGPHGVLVQVAVSRCGLAGVHDPGPRSFDGADIAVGQTCDPAHALHEVEGDALRPQDTARRPGHAGDAVTWRQECAVFQQCLQLQLGLDPPEHRQANLNAGQHPMCLGPQHAHSPDLSRHHSFGRGVVECLVLGNRRVDQGVDFGGELGQELAS